MSKNDFPIIKKLGGRLEAFRKLREVGYPAETPDALRMWSLRGNIPGVPMRLLMEIAQKEGKEYLPQDFFLN